MEDSGQQNFYPRFGTIWHDSTTRTTEQEKTEADGGGKTIFIPRFSRDSAEVLSSGIVRGMNGKGIEDRGKHFFTLIYPGFTPPHADRKGWRLRAKG